MEEDPTLNPQDIVPVEEDDVVRDPNRDQDPDDHEEEEEEGAGEQNIDPNRDQNIDPPAAEGKDSPLTKRPRFDLKHIVSEAEKFNWELPEELAEFFIHYCKTHVSESDVKLELEEFPAPSNVSCVPSMDATFKSTLKKEGANAAIDGDEDLSTIQKKIQDIMGPLGVAWASVELFRNGECSDLNEHILADQLQKATLLVGHAIQKVSWFRRLHSLSAMGTKTMKNVREVLKEPAVVKILQDDKSNLLIPTEFDQYLKSKETSRKNLTTAFGASNKKDVKTTKPSAATSAKRGKDTRQPFSSNPYQRGGGNRYNDNRYNDNNRRDGYTSNYNPFARSNYKHGDSGKGKYRPGSPNGQHALDSRLASKPQTCDAQSSLVLSSHTSDLTISRTNSKIRCELENDYQRPSNHGHRQRMGNPFAGYACAGENPTRRKNEQSGGISHGPGGREHVGQGGYKGSHTQTGPILEQHIRNPKRGGSVSSDNKSEGTKQICALPSFQNGRTEGSKTPSATRGLDGKAGPEGRLLLRPLGNSIPKIRPLQVEKEALRVPLPGVRSRTSTKDIHQTNEGSNISSEETRDPPGDISGRFINHSFVQGGIRKSKGHGHVPFPSPGINHKPEKIGLGSIPKIGISGHRSRQPVNVLLPLREENEKIDFSVSKGLFSSQLNPKGSVFANRKVEIDSNGGHTSPVTSQISPTVMHCGTIKTNALRASNIPISGGESGTKMVDRKSGAPKGKPDSSTTSRVGDMPGCSKNGRLGGSLSPGVNRGTMVRIGERFGHQRSGIAGSRAGNKDVHQGSQTHINSHEDRQYIGPLLPCKNGGHQKPKDAGHCQKNMALSVVAQDHDYCGMDSLPSEHLGRLGIQERLRLSRVETVPTGIPIDVSGNGTARLRSIRIKDVSPGQSLLQLEGRSGLPSSGRLSSVLESRLPLRVSPLLSHYKSSENSGNTEGAKDAPSNPSVAISTLVSSGPGHAAPPSRRRGPAKKPNRPDSSIDSGVISATSGLASIRDRLTEEGISEEASKLILNSRSRGTTQNYESAWKEWRLWCGERGVDPFTCPIKNVVNYLGRLFESGYEYRTIGVHRSAISAYHAPITNLGLLMPVGRHPQVSSLMSGVQKLRPPKPKYAFTWDIEAVLRLFRSWPLDLTPKQITIKTTTLLALIGVPRGAELHMFDLNYLAKYEDRYTFDLPGNIKNGKEGVVPEPVVFHKHLQDEKLCPVTCIEKYISLTEPWRPKGQPSTFFLSSKTHKPVCKSTLARWVKEVLHMADIDTKVFQAHSLRGASTSKAFLKGLSVREVVNHGKWSRDSTWQKFYHKPVAYPSQKYQDNILQL